MNNEVTPLSQGDRRVCLRWIWSNFGDEFSNAELADFFMVEEATIRRDGERIVVGMKRQIKRIDTGGFLSCN